MTPATRDESRSWHGFVRALTQEWRANKVTDAAAALTFYGILALFPFILFVVAAASLVIRSDQVQALGAALARDAPPALAPILLARLSELTTRPRIGVLTFSALAAVWSSTTGVTSLVSALNTAYGVAERRRQWKVYAMAFTVMLAAAVLALIAALVAVVIPITARWLGPSWQPLITWCRIPVAMFLMMIVWATIYYVLPDVPQTVRTIMPGSVAGVMVWLGATLVFSSYVSRFGSFGITYGALGGIVILLVWMWLTSLALMLGAEVNAVRRMHARAPDITAAK